MTLLQGIYVVGLIALPAGILIAERNSELPPIGGWPMACVLVIAGLLWPFWLMVILGSAIGAAISRRIWP